MQVALFLAYDGSHYFGSQIQNTLPTIQGALHQVLQALQIEPKTDFSGRTDKGVHATMQVVSLKLPSFWSDLTRLQTTLNKMLPHDIEVKKIIQVNDDFHARYSAKKRVYRYIISTARPSVFTANYVSYIKDVDFVALQEKIKLFEGKYDFCCFAKSGSDVKTTTREIYKAFAYKHKNYIILYFEANGFLRTQIRLMVGALIQHNADTIKMMLQQQCKKIKPAPPQGLYLAKIKY